MLTCSLEPAELVWIHPCPVYLFIEGIRGGISMINNRFSKANNPYVPNKDPKQATSYVMYVDANNPYGWGVCHNLYQLVSLPGRPGKKCPCSTLKEFHTTLSKATFWKWISVIRQNYTIFTTITSRRRERRFYLWCCRPTVRNCPMIFPSHQMLHTEQYFFYYVFL